MKGIVAVIFLIFQPSAKARLFLDLYSDNPDFAAISRDGKKRNYEEFI
jgi:hypothetical protein